MILDKFISMQSIQYILDARISIFHIIDTFFSKQNLDSLFDWCDIKNEIKLFLYFVTKLQVF